MLALISLGYKQVDAHKAVKAILPGLSSQDTEKISVEDVVREALKQLLS